MMPSPTPSQPRVAVACGGTGGHLFPGLAVADQLVQHGCAVTLLVSPKEVDQEGVRQARAMDVVTLPAVGLQRGSRIAFVRGFVQAYRAARHYFKSHPPAAALAMGGFTSAPPVLAAKRCGAPAFLHESNTIPGRANRWLSRLVEHAFVGFPSTAERLHCRNVTVTGTPVRAQFEGCVTAQCRSALGLDPVRPVVLVMGGSQGAGAINELVIKSLPELARLRPDWQWIHLAGANDMAKVTTAYATAALAAQVHAFYQRMELAMGAATVAISRSGASSLAELAAVRLPAVLVPYPTATDDHQWHNARAFETTGAARLLAQKTATPQSLIQLLTQLVENVSEHQAMQVALARWHAPRAAHDIAQAMLARLPEFSPVAGTPNAQDHRLDGPDGGVRSRRAVVAKPQTVTEALIGS